MQRLVAPDELLAETQETAARFARRSPVAVAALKRCLYVGGDRSLQARARPRAGGLPRDRIDPGDRARAETVHAGPGADRGHAVPLRPRAVGERHAAGSRRNERASPMNRPIGQSRISAMSTYLVYLKDGGIGDSQPAEHARHRVAIEDAPVARLGPVAPGPAGDQLQTRQRSAARDRGAADRAQPAADADHPRDAGTGRAGAGQLALLPPAVAVRHARLGYRCARISCRASGPGVHVAPGPPSRASSTSTTSSPTARCSPASRCSATPASASTR